MEMHFLVSALTGRTDRILINQTCFEDEKFLSFVTSALVGPGQDRPVRITVRTRSGRMRTLKFDRLQE